MRGGGGGRRRGILEALPWLIVAAALAAIAVIVAETVWPTTRASPAHTVPGRTHTGHGGEPSAGAPNRTPRAVPRPRWEAFARVRGMSLYLPAAHPVGVMYHE